MSADRIVAEAMAGNYGAKVTRLGRDKLRFELPSGDAQRLHEDLALRAWKLPVAVWSERGAVFAAFGQAALNQEGAS